jgi:ubiquinone/menaquinone biosynthesis C-methylase UbiE
MNKDTSLARKRYNRNSRFYDFIEFPIEFLLFRHWRKYLFKHIKGPRVLEIGIGTGKNLKYYRNDYFPVAIDLSEGMLSQAKPIAKSKGVSLVQMDAQRLAFPDNTFDTVLGTFVFCSIPDAVKGLREIKRVLKPDGQLLLVEHVLPKNALLRFLFNLFDPIMVSLVGAHIARKTSDNILKAGFELIWQENLLCSIFYFFMAKLGENK